MVGGTEIKGTLGVEGKGQQMSFRMTHDSFGPWRDSTVCVSLPCGRVSYVTETKLTPSSEGTIPLKARSVHTIFVSTNDIYDFRHLTRHDLNEMSFTEFLSFAFVSVITCSVTDRT